MSEQDKVSDSELWVLLNSAKRPHKVVDFPRKNPFTGEPLGKVAIWPLTQGEIIIAKAAATAYARECIKEKFDAVEKVEGYVQVFEDASMTELIYRFCRRPENTDLPVFPRAADVRAKLTSDECSVLINDYAIIQIELGPIVAHMTDVEFELIIERLKRGGSYSPLASLSLEQRIALTMYMVDRYVTLPTDNSSVGKPLGEPAMNA